MKKDTLYKNQIRQLCEILGYELISYSLGKNQGDTIVVFKNTKRKESSCSLRTLWARKFLRKNTTTLQKEMIYEKLNHAGFKIEFFLPSDEKNLTFWCREVCRALNRNFVKVELKSPRHYSRVYISDDKSVLLASLKQQLERRFKILKDS